ncbi:methyl-accepting chemotaxis protein [Methylobacterium gnaphalii]|uniref:methyl-accepting chemotaxis protein n=1 Tax=Methylobacterium gnaphalii TaxID=1010610 RepID=UPI0011BDF848|nr:methyl-accepting chemotaxis protein [Methylobacterium gnaphalii]
MDSLIRSIAEQINLPALHTAIAAARAGEAGRGFAAIAGEMKRLATQTTNAADELDTLQRLVNSAF